MHKTLNQKIVDYVSMVEKTSGNIRIVSGELNPVFYNHILIVLSFYWAAIEQGIDIKIIAGPVICVENKRQSAEISGSPLFLNVLEEWLKPVLENGWVEMQSNEDNKAILRGTEITIKSIHDVLRGKFFAYCQRPIESLVISESRKKYWLNEIENGSNANLYERLKEHLSKFTFSQWLYGVWPLFAGYEGSYEFCWASMLNQHIGSKTYLEKLLKRDPPRSQYRRSVELEKEEFFLPKNKEDLIKNCNLVMRKAIKERTNNPNWIGKKYPVGPAYFWRELYFQNQTTALKEARTILREIEI